MKFCSNCAQSEEDHRPIPGLFLIGKEYKVMRVCTFVVTKHVDGIADCCNCSDFKPLIKEEEIT